ncbi:MAG: hypothetical protein ACRDJM_05945 [Actinomycetota bacterium]
MSEAPGFESDIKPLFRDKDRSAMMFAFDLWEYAVVRDNASDILERVKAGEMPCDGAWTEEQIGLFQRWQEAGMTP